MNYTPKFFCLEEFVSQDIFKNYYNIAWSLLDDRILYTIDKLRIFFNKKIIINNWKWGGSFQNRGLRMFDSSVGAKYSQHKFGRAIDFDVDGLNANEVREYILKRTDIFEYITAMEININWVHIDCRYLYNEERIKLFNQ